MNRSLLKEIERNNVFDLATKAEQYFFVDFGKISQDSITLNLNEGNYDILVLCSNNKSLYINQKEDTNLKLSLLAKNKINSMKISANLSKKSTIALYFADFSIGESNCSVDINLNEPYASANWALASLTAQSDNKEFDVSIYHNAPNTYGISNNYGVCKNDGKLVFSGTSHIKKGCSKSKTYQNAKIMVFDRLSNGIAKPILKIDEHDIEASHAAVVGKINDDHLYYLTSRGISEATAKELITYGYLKPILVGFSDKEIATEINNLIEGRM